MSRSPRALACVLVVAAGWALACTGDQSPPELDVVGIWSREAGEGVVAIREFTGDEYDIEFTNRNWVVHDGAAPVLYSEARYFVVEDAEVPGGGHRDLALWLDTRDPNGFYAPSWDEVVSVSSKRLVLRSLADEVDYEYSKIEALP